jgi:hypothetical protein
MGLFLEAYELTIFNDNGTQETRTSDDLEQLKTIADDQYDDTNYDYQIIDDQSGELVYSNYEYVRDEKPIDDEDEDVDEDEVESSGRLMKIPDNVLQQIYYEIGDTYAAGGDPYDTVQRVLRTYGFNPYYYTEEAYDQFGELFGMTIDDAAKEIAAGGTENEKMVEESAKPIKLLGFASGRFSVKPYSWSEIKELPYYEDMIEQLTSLPQYSEYDLYESYRVPKNPTRDFVNTPEQSVFIFDCSSLSTYFLVNTEGFSYPRYITRLHENYTDKI